MRINSISLNSYKPQIRQNASFGKYDRKYDWCQDNPLISRSHPAQISPENIKFDNLEEIIDMVDIKKEVKEIKSVIEAVFSSRGNIAGREIAQRFCWEKLELSKTDDNKIKSYTITSKDGRKTVVKFGDSDQLFVAKGFEDKGTGTVSIDEFYYFDEYQGSSRFVKYINFWTHGSACTFDKAITSFDGKSFTFYPNYHNNTPNALNRFAKFQEI